MRLARNNIPEELLQKVPYNVEGTDYFVGDIHGMYDQLMDKLKERNFNFEKDRLFAVGDLIDRGPQNERVLDLLGLPWFYAVRGNHEDMMINHLYQGDIWYRNGGQWAYDFETRMGIRQEVLDRYLTIVENLPIALEVPTLEGDIGVMHTDPPNHWQELRKLAFREDYIWGRRRVRGNLQRKVQGIDRVVIGHTPMLDGPWLFGNVVNLDAGTYGTNIIHVLTAREVLTFNKKVKEE